MSAAATKWADEIRASYYIPDMEFWKYFIYAAIALLTQIGPNDVLARLWRNGVVGHSEM
jgi:hypothetical protein